jgi:hypothetical protein
MRANCFSKESCLHLLVLSLALCLSLSPIQPLLAQGAIVHPEPLAAEIGQDQVEIVHVVLQDTQDAYAIDVQASFDPTAVEVVDANPEQDGVQVIPGDFLKPDFAVRNTADNNAGTLQYVITQVNPSEPATGTGTVFSIQFRGKALGAQSALRIDSVQIADRRGATLGAQPQNGTLAVVAPKPPTPAPVVAAAAAVAIESDPQAAAPAVAAESVQQPSAPAEPLAAAAPAAAPAATDDSLLLLLSAAGLAGTIMLLIATFFVLRRRRTPTSDAGRYRL